MGLQESFIVWLQSNLHPGWDLFFKGATELGGIQGMILFWTFFVWCVSHSWGCRLILMTEVAHYIGSLWLKAIFALPRPFEVSREVIPIITEKGFSFPSGHSLNALMQWGALAWFVRKRIVTFLSILLILLVGLSRIYLGVHYPMDVLGGFLLGGIFLWLWTSLYHFENSFLNRAKPALKILLVIGLLLILILPLHFFGLPGIPKSWTVVFLTLLSAAMLGWILNSHWIHFQTDGSWMKRLLRFILGNLVLLPLLYLFPKGIWVYVFTGLWITAGAPYLFLRLGLAQKNREQ